jgi:2-polyprenyl-3-methyl-5-hydroxy-6-metoxy-1,4-benzoquinol methylase
MNETNRSSGPVPADLVVMNREGQAIWDANAETWDANMGDAGGGFQRGLIGPVVDRLLAVQPGERVLDAATGNGVFARRLAAQGAQVVAFDFSRRLLELAQQRSGQHADRISYHHLDATDEQQVTALGACSFDAALCSMGLMDMPTIEPLLAALARVLKPGGRFVFAVMHPCFNTHAVTMVAEQSEIDGTIRRMHTLRIAQYLGLRPARGLALRGQPLPQYYFHRPLSVIFGSCFRAGFVLDALEEPAEPALPGAAPFDRGNYAEFPPVLIARLRLVSPPPSQGSGSRLM